MKTDNEKNIWLVPTDDETVLFKDHTGLFTGINYQIPNTINSIVKGFNIYITNDETIENRDYYIDALTNLIYRAERTAVTMKCFKKIILTTDINLRTVQKIKPNTSYWFCEESNKLGKPVEFIETRKEHREGDLFFYEAILPKKENANWTDALNHQSKEVASVKFTSVHQLNEDGTQTDITDKPELWHIEDENNERLNQCPTFSIKDDSEIVQKPLYGTYLFDNLQEIAKNLVDHETNASVESAYRKQLEKYVLIGLKAEEGKITLDDMQYYMEYCQKNGYVTPKEWITNHKHF